MFRKVTREETPLAAKLVTETYEESKIVIPVKIHSVSGKTVTILYGNRYYSILEGDTFSMEVDPGLPRVEQKS